MSEYDEVVEAGIAGQKKLHKAYQAKHSWGIGEVLEWDYEKKLQDAKYILAGLRMYGDMLAECISDPAMRKSGNEVNLEGFIADQEEVERLIIEYKDTIQTYEEQLK